MRPNEMTEADWRTLSRELQPIALERFCARVLEKIGAISGKSDLTQHERYLKVYRLIEREDRKLGSIFNDLRRSSALSALMGMRSAGLLNDEEYERISEETRAKVDFLLSR